MPAKTYSAGTIFLQVVPVFGDTMRAIQREAKAANAAWGDEMEKGGQEAGKRAGKAMGEEVTKAAKSSGEKAGADYAGAFQEKIKASLRGAQREIDTLNFKTLSDDAEDRLKRIGKLFKELDAEITPDMDDKKVRAKLAFLQADLRKLTEGKHELHIDENLAEVVGKVEGGLKVIDKALDKRRVIEIETKISDRDLGSFEKKLRDTAKRAGKALGDSLNPAIRDIKQRLDGLADAEIGIDISADAARAQIIEIDQALQRLPDEVDVDLSVNSAVAHAELLAFRTAVNALDGRDIDLNVDVDGAPAAIAKVGILRAALGALSGAFATSGSGGDAAANSFRSFNFVVLAAVTLVPALIPILGAAGGALLALIPILGAVGAGLGTMILGFSGIGDAVGALGDVKDNAAKDIQSASQTMANAANAVADAERALAEARRAGAEAVSDAARAVARAREAAAEAIEDALKRQREAQEDYRDAVKDVAEAERDLAAARQEGRYELLDLDNQVEQNQIDIGQGVISVFEAQANFDAVMSDGSATNQERDAAALALQEAELRLKELRQEQERLAKAKKKADKEGLEGTNAVTAAQEALTQAVEDQQEAEENLAEAAENVAETRVDAAEQIADAERNLARARASAARQVADAERNLARAQQGYADAVQKTGDLGSASMQKLEQAMNKLGPAGRKFARFLFSLRGDFYRLRDAVQAALLPPVQRAMEQIMGKYGPQFQNFATSMATTIGGLFETLADRMTTSPAWQSFFGVMEDLGPVLLENFGLTMINFMEAFASLMTIVAPYAERLSFALVDISERFAEWMASGEGTKFWEGFMDYAQRVGPKVVDFFVALWDAAVNLVKAIAPWGEVILGVLTGILDFIGGMDTKTLGLIAASVITLVTAFMLAVGAAALWFAGAAVFATTAGTIIFFAVLIVGAIVAAYIHFETFRNIVNKVMKAIAKISKWAWESVLKPVFKAWLQFAEFMVEVYAFIFPIIVEVWKTAFEVMGWVWRNVLEPIFSAIIAVVGFLWKNVFKPVLTYIWKAWSFAFRVMKGAWTGILWPILDLFIKIGQKLWAKVFKPALQKLGDKWADMSKKMKAVWDLVLRPIFDVFREKVLPKLQTAFETVMGAITKVWNTLKQIFAKPIVFVVDTILNNGLIAGFNKVAKAVGSKGMDNIPLSQGIRNAAEGKFATGGVLPGYTPGQDVHHFTSPSGGRLHLSGGEAIMRPEFTSVVGSGWVDKMNLIARAEGRTGIKRAMGGGSYFLGGVIPLPGARAVRHASGYSSAWAGDLNVGSGYDDFGMAVRAWKAGQVAAMRLLGDTSYGRYMDISHGAGQSSRYAHLSAFAPSLSVGSLVAAGRTIGFVGDLGNTGTPPTSHLHFEVNGGGVDAGDMSGGGGGNPLAGFAKWLIKAAKNPLGYIKGLVTSPVQTLVDKFGDNRFVNFLADAPGTLLEGFKDSMVRMLPGPLRALAGDASGAKGNPQTGADLADGSSGTGIGAAESGGYFRGGVLPYNGTMKYDSGGYLPPGLTSVVNMTGRPEPVFTADQFDNMGSGGETFHYEPHFEGSDLSASDVVRDMDHARRRYRREGRYARNR